MGNEIDKVTRILVREFSKKRKLYIATSNNDIPHAKILNTYYWQGSFYIIEDGLSDIVQQISKNKKVSLCASASFHNFQGDAINLGHLQNSKNKEIRELKQTKFSELFLNYDDKPDSTKCLLKIKINKAFIYANKIGYNIDFSKNKIDSFHFAPND